MGIHKKQIKSYLQISNILLINGGFLDNPVLYLGEAGLILFFLDMHVLRKMRFVA